MYLYQMFVLLKGHQNDLVISNKKRKYVSENCLNELNPDSIYENIY